MKRRVYIFGRSVPLAVVLLAMLVIVAVAWGLVSTFGVRLSGTTHSGILMHWESPLCTITEPGDFSPSITSCTIDPDLGPQVVIDNAGPGLEMQIEGVLYNDTADIAICALQLVDPAVPGINFVPFDFYGIISNQSFKVMRINLVFDDNLVPGAPLSFDLPAQFDDSNAGNCGS